MTESIEDEPKQPPLPTNWDRCHAYNHRKRRYCRQMPVPDAQSLGNRYCGNHMHLMDNNAVHAKRRRVDKVVEGKTTNRKNGKRIPCPIDPSHSIFESAVSKHVLVCPAAMHEQHVAAQKYYSKDVNRGGFGNLGKDSDHNLGGVLISKRQQDLALGVLRVFHHLFRLDHSDDETLSPSSEQLKSLREQEIYNSIPEVDLSYEEENTIKPELMNSGVAARERQTKGVLSEAIAIHRIKAGGPRHIHQIASILGHVRKMTVQINNTASNIKDGNPHTPSTNIIEMGAGRGMLGLIVAGSASASNIESKVNLFLVDRSGSRAKAETKIRSAIKDGTVKTNNSQYCFNLERVEVTRIKADLAHVHMPTALPFLTKSSSNESTLQISKTVVIAKHLCGSGTDLALKSLCDIASSIDGCVMATCCHGLCDWDDYTGRESLLELFCGVGGLNSFGKQDFNVLKRWTSASVLENRCTSCAADDNRKHCNESIGVDERINIFNVVKDLELSCGGKGLGRMCQRIIDYGRCEYMRKILFCSEHTPKAENKHETLFDVKLVHYVPRTITPQNALLVAHRN